jgi:hypothetical protein
MITVNQNLQPLYRGDNREYNLTFTNINGEAIDITNWKIYFTVKKNYNDNDNQAIIKKDITIHYDPRNGKTKIILLPVDTDNLVPNRYYYDIQIKRGVEDIITILQGKILIKADVTRRTD